jgi:polyhydroxybutyrate depolymerase
MPGLPLLLLAGALAAAPTDTFTPPARAEKAIRPATSAPAALTVGDHLRTLTVGGIERTYRVHVPPSYDAAKPTPVVLVFHGAGMSARAIERYTRMDRTADRHGFLAVYPNGTGFPRAFNAGGVWGMTFSTPPDDVAFVEALLAELERTAHVDRRRVYACGLSNGGMFCYRLAGALSDRIAAVASVAGSLAVSELSPARPVPVLHFHGTEDTIVPVDGPDRRRTPRFLTFRSLDETISTWRRIDHCAAEPARTEVIDTADDGTKVIRRAFEPVPGETQDGAEVVLYLIEGGGHTWPGRPGIEFWVGRATLDISANECIWKFFEEHPLPETAAAE